MWLFSRGQSSSEPGDTRPEGMKQLSDHVWLLCDPEGPPVLEIVFIHGLQLSDFKEAFWTTWIARDENGNDLPRSRWAASCWPMTWLKEEFPAARILLLSYDSSALKTYSTGRADPYILGESLVQEMVVLGKVGQHMCPVVFVCHSLGGLIVKEIVIKAHHKFGDREEYQNFLKNIRGFHFYATPHQGSKLADLASLVPGLKMGPLVEYLKIINENITRREREFEGIANRYAWKFYVVAELHETKYGVFSAVVVEGGSARYGNDNFTAVGADHFGVCKPKSTRDSIFLYLKQFIKDVTQTDELTLSAVARRQHELLV